MWPVIGSGGGDELAGEGEEAPARDGADTTDTTTGEPACGAEPVILHLSRLQLELVGHRRGRARTGSAASDADLERRERASLSAP